MVEHKQDVTNDFPGERLRRILDWGYTDSRQDEQDRGITVKASSMSLVLQDSKDGDLDDKEVRSDEHL